MKIFKNLLGNTEPKVQPLQEANSAQQIEVMELSEDERLIAEIHNEFDTAPGRILQQALEIINTEKESKETLKNGIVDKALRLKALGFEKNALVHNLTHTEREITKKEGVIDMNTEMAHLVNYYTSNYPFLKFLPETELDRICDKYGLVYAPVKHYRMPIPDKNLSEIENAQPLREKDEQKILVTYKFANSYDSGRAGFKILVDLFGGDTFTREELEKIHLKYFGKITEHRLADTFWYYGYLAKNGDIQNPVIKEPFLADATETTYDRRGLFIAAPKEHFDLKDLTFDEKKGYYHAKTVRIIKDPIVFRYVKGGIQVLSKWGLEAEDPALQHEILN
jgi:hypothetical protein